MFDDYTTTYDITYGIRRPTYVSISGSFALKQLLNYECDIPVEFFECNDIDLYVEILHKEFSLSSFLEFHSKFMDLGFIDKNFLEEYKEELYNNSTSGSDSSDSSEESNFKKISNNLKIQCMRHISSKINDLITSYNIKKILKGDYLEIEEIEEYINGGFCVNKFVKLIDGWNYEEEYIELDMIFISKDIEKYTKENFDLSIVKNYIKNNNQIVSIYKDHVINGISEYKFSLFKERIKNSYVGISKFIERIKKYSERDFKIYMTFECGCKNINCDDSLYLNKENIKLFEAGFFVNIFYRLPYEFETIEDLITIYNYNSIEFIESIIPLAEIIIKKIRLLWDLKKILAGPKYIMQTIDLED